MSTRMLGDDVVRPSAYHFCPLCHVKVDRQATLCPSRECGQRPPDDGWPSLPYVLDGRYRLVEQIGRGGMGVVYKAQPLQNGNVVNEWVAVKLPLSEAHWRLLVRKVDRELKVAPFLGMLGGFVDVREAQRAHWPLYYVMEYVADPTLERILFDRRGPLEVGRACAIARAIAVALSRAHARGLVHCDVKPANIFVGEAEGHPPRVLICDLGNARILREDDDEQAKGRLRATHPFGTTRYLAPEQVDPNAQVDGRADIYSLGVVFYEMLTGQWPYPETEDAGEQIRHHLQTGAQRAVPNVPAPVLNTVLRCLEKDPADRFARMEELVQTLDLALQSAATLDPQFNTLDQTRPLRRRTQHIADVPAPPAPSERPRDADGLEETIRLEKDLPIEEPQGSGWWRVWVAVAAGMTVAYTFTFGW